MVILDLLLGRRRRRGWGVREKRNPWLLRPATVKRVIVDGREYLARDIVSVTDDEVVIVDLDGTMRTIKRRARPRREED